MSAFPGEGAALVGVGVGPGQADLLTLRAVDALRAADRVLAPTTSAESVGRAEAVVREVVPEAAIERVVFVMEVDSAARSAAIEHAATRTIEHLDAGERIAFVTIGDPNVYSTFGSIAEEVRRRRPDVPVSTVPGIMAFQDLAARSGTVLVDGTEHLVLVPAHRGVDGPVAAAVAEPGAAVVVYKGGRRLGELAEALDANGRLEGAVLGELLGLPGERIAPLDEAADAPTTYLATVIAPPVRERP